MKTIFYTGLLLVVFSSSMCHKPKTNTTALPYYPMDTEFKNSFLQGWDGSYWIYTDSLGTYYDTVTLVSAGKSIGGLVNTSRKYDSESYDTHYDATNCVDYFTYLKTIPIETQPKGVLNTFQLRNNASGDFYIESINSVYSTNSNLQVIDSITLLGKKYFNVLKLTAGTMYNTVIIDPTIGIVYKEAWSSRPSMGVKNFYLKEYKLK